jgi:hypothetical protein
LQQTIGGFFVDNVSLLRSIIKHKLLPNASKVEAVLPSTDLPAVDPQAAQTNIPEKKDQETPGVIPDSKDIQNPSGVQEKKQCGRPKFEMESMLKSLAVIEYQVERCKDESYIKEMDDLEKEKVEALASAISAMKQTISEMVSSWE